MSLGTPVNHYEALGVPMDADTATIHAAWRRRVVAVHPDRARDAIDETARTAATAELNAAWSILSNPAKRAAYDLDCGMAATTQARTYTPAPETWREQAPAYNPTPADWAYAPTTAPSASGLRLPGEAVFQAAGLGGFVAMGALLTTFATLPLAFPMALAAGVIGLMSLAASSMRASLAA